MQELKRYAGIQFDPKVVEAFGRTKTASATLLEPDEPDDPDLAPASIPMLGQVASARSRGALTSSSAPAEP
jgi:hypothetical protein